MHRLLSRDGAICVQLDDTEACYAKVVLDEIFGRQNYITTITVESSTASSFRTINLGPTQVSNFIFFYCKDKTAFDFSMPYIGSSEVDLSHFSRFIENIESPAEDWRFQSINSHILSEMGFLGKTSNAQWAAAKRELGNVIATEVVKEKANAFALDNAHRVFETKTLQKPSKWLLEHISRSREVEHVIALERDGMDPIYLYKGRQVYFLGKGIKEIDGERVLGQPVTNIWTDIPTNNLQNEGGVSFPSGKKPEFLVRRIIQMCTSKPEHIVLDIFAGSGTTGAVAHKMGRRWIMVELLEHCETHIVPRLKSIIDAQDATGVTSVEKWNGGGGFRYYRLAPSLLTKDAWGNWVISEVYDPAKLAQAVCKLMGFVYQPDETNYWMQGRSSETDFIYVTTQNLTHEQLAAVSEEVGDERTLLVCCKAFHANADAFPNLTIRKIPQAVLRKCEWGHDDYSLNVANLPEVPQDVVTDADDAPSLVSKTKKKRGNDNTASQKDLFNQEGDK